MRGFIHSITRQDFSLRSAPNYWDVIALLLISGCFFVLAWGGLQMSTPYQLGDHITISLAPSALPMYAVRSVMRMFIGIALSLVFTFIFGTAAAKSRYAERLIIPAIDILQSVPVLGFLSVSVWAFIAVFPHSLLGPEFAAIFAIFTSQVWNMVLSFYQSLRTLPVELGEVAQMLRLSAWQRFWRIEVPFAMPGLLWNTMLSLSAGWFFVVACEAIAVSNQTILLPGIGSYIRVAIDQANMHAIYFAIVAMFVVILAYDQLVFRPMMLWAEKFQAEQQDEHSRATSWVVTLFRHTKLFRLLNKKIIQWGDRVVNLFVLPQTPVPVDATRRQFKQRLIQASWWLVTLLVIGGGVYVSATYIWGAVSGAEVLKALGLGLVTAVRIFVLIALCVVFWLPIGVWIGLRPRWAHFLQPIIQFLAAFPANLIFPLVVSVIVHHQLNVDLWTSPLIVLGTQWYILFNVIAGAQAMPKSLQYAVKSLQVSRWLWWKRLALPALFPYLITGVIAAVGGAWNASVVAEAVEWGNTRLEATGLGAYIARATWQGEFAHLALGIVVMCVYVLVINRLVWKPLYDLAERRYRVAT